MKRLLFAALAAMLCLSPLRAQDAPWPSRSIRLIVPAGPGGTADTRVRWLAPRLGASLGQTIVIENRTGAGGNVGTAEAAHAPADGYTLVMVHQGTMTVNPHLYAKTGYDALNDFAPVARLAANPLVLAVTVNSPIRSVSDLIQAAKAKPGSLSFGSPGFGTPPHLAGELLKHMASIDVTHVPYRGGGQSISDVIGGQVSFTLEGTSTMLPFVKSGRLRAIAVTSAQRLDLMPNVPTLSEAGVAGYEFISWTGIAVPRATPRPIIDRLRLEIGRIYNSPEGREYMSATAGDWRDESPAEFAADIRTEHARWGQFVRETGLRAE